jgi:hypothetical protein
MCLGPGFGRGIDRQTFGSERLKSNRSIWAMVGEAPGRSQKNLHKSDRSRKKTMIGHN